MHSPSLITALLLLAEGVVRGGARFRIHCSSNLLLTGVGYYGDNDEDFVLGKLVMKGRMELHQLALRLSLLFPLLLKEENLSRISLRSSSKHRCVSSIEAFQEGLWRKSGDDQLSTSLTISNSTHNAFVVFPQT